MLGVNTVTGSKWSRDGQVEIQDMIKSYAGHKRMDIIKTVVFDGFLGIGFKTWLKSQKDFWQHFHS